MRVVFISCNFIFCSHCSAAVIIDFVYYKRAPERVIQLMKSHLYVCQVFF